jgi:hypothetical protein
VGISVLLTTTMVGMRAAVEVVHGVYDSGRLSIVVGGAPLTAEFAAAIDADAFAPDAGAAVEVVKGLLARRPVRRGRGASAWSQPPPPARGHFGAQAGRPGTVGPLVAGLDCAHS